MDGQEWMGEVFNLASRVLFNQAKAQGTIASVSALDVTRGGRCQSQGVEYQSSRSQKALPSGYTTSINAL